MKRVLVLSTILAAGLGTAALAQNPEVLQQRPPNMPAPNQMPAEKIEHNTEGGTTSGPSSRASTRNARPSTRRSPRCF